METTRNTGNLRLEHQRETYRMVIPKDVENKIRLLCREIPDVEWSGVLFYKVSGSFLDGSLVVTCVDIFQMDEGSSGYTEYDVSPDVSAYMVDHPELLGNDVYQGHIHSHNRMKTFFSGTDTSTLLAEGSDVNHFVSLIVNNEGTYTAGITRRVTSTIHREEAYEFPSWNDTVVHGVTHSEDSDRYVQWFNLDIEVERSESSYETEMLGRIREIRSLKSGMAHRPYPGIDAGLDKYAGMYGAGNDYDVDKRKTQSTLFDMDDAPLDCSKVRIDPRIVNSVMMQALTCSVIINPDKIDLDKWMDSMDRLCSRRFHNPGEYRDYVESLVEFLMFTTDIKPVPDCLDDVEQEAALAYNVIKRLESLPKNEWIDTLINVFNDYTM